MLNEISAESNSVSLMNSNNLDVEDPTLTQRENYREHHIREDSIVLMQNDNIGDSRCDNDSSRAHLLISSEKSCNDPIEGVGEGLLVDLVRNAKSEYEANIRVT